MLEIMRIQGLEQEMGDVDAILRRFLSVGREEHLLQEMLTQAAGGKRLRPLLMLVVGRLGPGYPRCRPRLCELAALVELVHCASLIHDDIVDDSPLRRGQPTIQSHFGKERAVYAGDLLLARVMQFLLQQGLLESGQLLAQAIQSMCCGEIGQYGNRYNTEVTVRQYYRQIQGKTAALFATSCRISALESGCVDWQIETLAAAGEQLGLLFQIRDDLLDFLSDPQSEGKPVHADLLEGIYTLPLVYALGQPRLKQELVAAIECFQAGQSEQDFAQVLQLVERAGGIRYARQCMAAHAAQARRLLTGLVPGEAQAALDRLIGYLAPGGGYSREERPAEPGLRQRAVL